MRQKKGFLFIGLIILKMTGVSSMQKYALGPEILIKMCQNPGRQTKPAYFAMFKPISRDLFHIFQNQVFY